jgi:hypothetical protein
MQIQENLGQQFYILLTLGANEYFYEKEKKNINTSIRRLINFFWTKGHKSNFTVT